MTQSWRTSRRSLLMAGAIALPLAGRPAIAAPTPRQPLVANRSKGTIRSDGLVFKDLDGSGVLAPYKDWRLSARSRALDLVARMTLEEKAGLLMHASVNAFVGADGEVLDVPLDAGRPGVLAATISVPGFSADDRPSPRHLVDDHVRFMMLGGPARPLALARWTNTLQERAEGSRLGIPLVFSAERRNLAKWRDGKVSKPDISWWPSEIGLAAVADVGVAHRFGTLVGAEYRAMGLRMTLGPQIDLATDPRWTRTDATFGDGVDLVSAYGSALVEGFQGKKLGHHSVLTVAKHWPGGGALKDGLDSHNSYGRYQVYPGGQLDLHKRPFRAAIAAGVSAVMPSYAIAEGIDDVAMAFSRRIVETMLRKEEGFDGIVLSDWLRAMPWGVEALNLSDRQKLMLEAGVDQFGGEHDWTMVAGLVRSGGVSEARLEKSVLRVLEPMFAIGIFENPYTSVDDVAVDRHGVFAAARRGGLDARRRSVTVIRNDGALPLRHGLRLWGEGIDPQALTRHGQPAPSPQDADAIIVKVEAPYAVHQGPGAFFKGRHEGTLAYAGADNAPELARIRKLADTGKPVIVLARLDRAAIVREYDDLVAAIVIDFGVADADMLGVVFGLDHPRGRLPFDLPDAMEQVEHQKSDMPGDLGTIRYPRGSGLTW
jgi:beta-glucosidase